MDKKDKQIYLIVPKLIEQSTWGGDYILKSKNWEKRKEFQNIKIGQSYELFSETKVRSDIDSSADFNFTGELGYAMEPDKNIYKGDNRKLIPISKLIKKDPLGFLGETALKKNGPQIKILIKFTQAKGNSFQLHVRRDNRKWKAKPESWFYLEPGLITLGTKKGIDWSAYQKDCLALDSEMKKISQGVIKKEITLKEAQAKAEMVVKKYNPWQYVNILKTKKEELIDLSQGAVHHSWEEDKKLPLGNIVYELCYDVMDPVSVLRNFDKGKLKSDGSLRKLDINDYFKYIDRSEKNNNPQTLKIKAKKVLNSKNIKIEALLRTRYYSVDRMVLKEKYQGEFTDSKKSFHHLFARRGTSIINGGNSRIVLSPGHSCFIPAAIGEYSITPKSKAGCEILKTFII